MRVIEAASDSWGAFPSQRTMSANPTGLHCSVHTPSPIHGDGYIAPMGSSLGDGFREIDHIQAFISKVPRVLLMHANAGDAAFDHAASRWHSPAKR